MTGQMMPRRMASPDGCAWLTLAADGGRIVANFYGQDGDETGTTPHPFERSMAQVIAHYQGFGWVLVDERAAAGGCRVSSWWALWSTDDPARLLDLISYDTGPVTEARAREGLGRAVVPLDGTLEAIDQTRLTELRETHRKTGAQS